MALEKRVQVTIARFRSKEDPPTSVKSRLGTLFAVYWVADGRLDLRDRLRGSEPIFLRDADSSSPRLPISQIALLAPKP
ncbi:hypothetical protein L596_018781 [Steinernema carpocapsae]|uniref:Uncharacterized protein n=1 Tax=Steinernema carpocapsae TaxID=34508 RepID=A0A4U5N6G8_STECR|nr:hypothetical protein L596_018781 [Steinernema carpocapsae]